MIPLKKRYEIDAWNMISDFLKNLNSELLKAKVNSEKAREIVNDIASHIYYRADDYFEIEGIISYDNVLTVLNEIGTTSDIVSTFKQNPESLTSLEDPLNYYSKSKEADDDSLFDINKNQPFEDLSILGYTEKKLQQITKKPIKITIIPALFSILMRTWISISLFALIVNLILNDSRWYGSYSCFGNALILIAIFLLLDIIIAENIMKNATGIIKIDNLCNTSNSYFILHFRLIYILEFLSVLFFYSEYFSIFNLIFYVYEFLVLSQILFIEYYFGRNNKDSWIFWLLKENSNFNDRLNFVLPRVSWIIFLYSITLYIISINSSTVININNLDLSPIFVLTTITIVLILVLKYFKDLNQFEEFSFYIWTFRIFLVFCLLRNKFLIILLNDRSLYLNSLVSYTILIFSIICSEIALDIFLIKKCNYLSATLPTMNRFINNPSDYNYPASKHVSSFLNSIDNYSTIDNNIRAENLRIAQKNIGNLTKQVDKPKINPNYVVDTSKTQIIQKSQLSGNNVVTMPKIVNREEITPNKNRSVNIIRNKDNKPKFGNFISFLFKKILLAAFTLVFLYYNILYISLIIFYREITTNWAFYEIDKTFDIFNNNHQFLFAYFDVILPIGIIISTIVLYQKTIKPVRTRSDFLNSFLFLVFAIELFIIFLLINNLLLFFNQFVNSQRIYLAFIFLIIDIGALLLLWVKPKVKKIEIKDSSTNHQNINAGGINIE